MNSPSVLVLNPNTTATVTEFVADTARRACNDQVIVHAATARFGGAYIACELTYAVGAHAAVEACVAHVARHGPPRAVLVACFGEPGVHALRSLTTAPVMGLAEASLRAASQRWSRYRIVTGGKAWVPMLERFVRAEGLETGLVGIDALPLSGAELAADPAMAVRTLARACEAAARDAMGIILGGAGLGPFATAVRAHCGAPLIDSVEAGVEWLTRLDLRPAPDFSDAAWRALRPPSSC